MLNYQLGRNEWRTFEQGLEKEWLLANGLGGFANQTIIGANNRIYSGYLIAAINPPVDRMLILANTHEGVSKKGERIDLCAQEYIQDKREGQYYLNRFTLDVLPTYTYQVDDMTIKKTVSMVYGENTCVICYEIENGDEEAIYHVTPLFNCRPAGEVAERGELKYTKTIEGKVLSLTFERNPELPIRFYTSEGTYYERALIPTSMATPNYLIEENDVYRMDNRTGFLGVDNHATPIEVQIKIGRAHV